MDTSMVTPDIASMSMIMAQNKIQTGIGTAVLAKSLHNYEDNGAALTKMMELSVDPTLGANFDMSV